MLHPSGGVPMSSREVFDRLTQAARGVVERRLPWYDADRERARTRHTEAIRLRSIRTRIRTERRLADLGHAYDDAENGLRR
jgi:hypothetical protein